MELEKLGIKVEKILSKGAEAYLYLANFFGIRAVAKVRVKKNYRNPKLDQYLRVTRTRREAKLLVNVKKLGIPAPILYGFFPNEAVLVIEYIEGELLYSVFKRRVIEEKKIESIASRLGSYIGTMHENGMTHGDLTTSNIMYLGDERIVLIDFGLGTYTKSVEDFGIELRVLYNSLRSAHYDISDIFFEAFSESYKRNFSMGEESLKKFEEIKLRGRYVEERREKRRFFKETGYVSI